MSLDFAHPSLPEESALSVYMETSRSATGISWWKPLILYALKIISPCEEQRRSTVLGPGLLRGSSKSQFSHGILKMR